MSEYARGGVVPRGSWVPALVCWWPLLSPAALAALPDFVLQLPLPPERQP